MFIKIAKIAVLKILTYKNGSLVLVNSGISAAITISFYFNELLAGASTKNLVLPIVIYLFGFAIYFLLSIVDLITGLMNAKYQNSLKPVPDKNYIKNYRLWFTFWKSLGICIFNMMLMCFCFLAELAKPQENEEGFISYLGAGLYTTFIWFLVTGWSMASAFEFSSIGDNIEKRIGIKYRFFSFFDNIINIAQKKIILKAKNSFNSLEPEPEEMEKIENPPNLNPNENEKVN